MDLSSTDTLLLLDRPSPDTPSIHRRGTDGSDGRTGVGRATAAGRPVADLDATSGDIRFFLRAPALAVLAAVFLVEGYRWLGIIHVGTAVVGSLVFGTAGLALVALCAPVAAVVLTSGRPAPGWVEMEDIVVVASVAVTVATGAALVVGGAAWHDAAGTADLLMAGSALATVFVGERARRRPLSHGPSGVTTEQ